MNGTTSMTIDRAALDEFTTQYIETALWSSHDESDESGGEPMDANYGIEDIAKETLAAMVADCKSFQSMFGEHIAGKLSRAGQDFWLTRNGYGAGFWDGDWREPYRNPDEDLSREYSTVGGFLTAMSKPYGSYDLYVGDDGLIHGS